MRIDAIKVLAATSWTASHMAVCSCPFFGLSLFWVPCLSGLLACHIILGWRHVGAVVTPTDATNTATYAAKNSRVGSEVAKQLRNNMPVAAIDLRNERMTWREVKD